MTNDHLTADYGIALLRISLGVVYIAHSLYLGAVDLSSAPLLGPQFAARQGIASVV